MLDDSRLLTFAQSCASLYCKKHNSFQQFDDATQEACLYLLQHREKWSQSEQSLRCRVVGELERKYQNERGLRLSDPPRFIEAEKLDRYASQEPTVSQSIKTIDSVLMLRIVDEVKQLPDFQLEPTRSILDAALRAYYPRKEIAAQYDMRTSDVTRLVKRFKATCRRRYNKTLEHKNEKKLFD